MSASRAGHEISGLMYWPGLPRTSIEWISVEGRGVSSVKGLHIIGNI